MTENTATIELVTEAPVGMQAVKCGVCGNPTGEGHPTNQPPPEDARCSHCVGLPALDRDDEIAGLERQEGAGGTGPGCPHCGAHEFAIRQSFYRQCGGSTYTDEEGWDAEGDGETVAVYGPDSYPEIEDEALLCMGCDREVDIPYTVR